MDPNEALKLIREIVRRHGPGVPSDELCHDSDIDAMVLEALTSAFQRLDEHLSRGGVLPRDWNSASHKHGA